MKLIKDQVIAVYLRKENSYEFQKQSCLKLKMDYFTGNLDDVTHVALH